MTSHTTFAVLKYPCKRSVLLLFLHCRRGTEADREEAERGGKLQQNYELTSSTKNEYLG